MRKTIAALFIVFFLAAALKASSVSAIKDGDPCKNYFIKNQCGDDNSLCKCTATTWVPIRNMFSETEWKCEPCAAGEGCTIVNSRAKCVKGATPSTPPATQPAAGAIVSHGTVCQKTEVGQTRCDGSFKNQCECKVDGNGQFYTWFCLTACANGCNQQTGKCNGAAAGKSVNCAVSEYIEGSEKGKGRCRRSCTCTGMATSDECSQTAIASVKSQYPSYTFVATGTTKDGTTVAATNVKAADCQAAAVSTPLTDAEKKKQEEDRNKQCKSEVGADYSCIDTSNVNTVDYDCKAAKCNIGTDAKNPKVLCCKSLTEAAAQMTAEQKAAYEKNIQDIASSIATQTCKPALNKSQDEWEAAISKAKSQCNDLKILLPQFSGFVPLASMVTADCKKEIDSICRNVNIPDKKVKVLTDCAAFCDDPDGCSCPETCTYNSTTGGTQVIRYEPGKNKAHIQMNSNCVGSVNAGICSGKKRDGICPRQCFWFNDIDCQSQKTAGYLIGDIAMRFFAKQKWYQDFMSWVSGWSKWIDPKQWIKSWCNPANRKQGIIDSVALYSDDGEIYAWYGGERAVYNYTKAGSIASYLYTVTWGIGNLPTNVSYKITLAKELTGQSVRAFPANSEWYTIKAGEKHQGKETAKAFFLKTTFSYVCMEFSSEFQGATRYCREISEEGEYRATGDPAVVTPEGYTTASGSNTNPASDSGVNCQLSGTC